MTLLLIRHGRIEAGMTMDVQSITIFCGIGAEAGMTVSVFLTALRLSGKTAMSWKQILLPCGIGILISAVFGGLLFLRIRYSRNKY